MAVYTDAIGDQLRLNLAQVLASPLVIRNSSISDAVGVAESVDRLRDVIVNSGDSFQFAYTLALLSYYKPVFTETVGVGWQTNAGEPVSASDSVSVAVSTAAAYVSAIIESIGLSRTTLASAINGMTLTEAINLLDGLFKFFSADVSETVALDPTVIPTKLAIGTLTGNVGVASTVNRTLVLRITAPDGFEFEDTEALKLFFRPTLQDYVQIAAAYIAPDDVFTVWNINAINGAVTQYDNYVFNSFARFGQMYLGADSEGLYELNGCNDEGSAIIARIKSGLAQLTESRFTMIRDAYIGMRGDGTFVLRIATGEGDVYDYTFDTESMKTVRVPLGKGMRTRYVSFELISTGSDFDLESVEFIPLMSSRRV